MDPLNGRLGWEEQYRMGLGKPVQKPDFFSSLQQVKAAVENPDAFLKPMPPDGTITQGSWTDFNPVAKGVVEGLKELVGVAPSERVMKRLGDVRSPLLRPQSAFEWADYGAGLAADAAQTGLAATDLAAFAPVVGRRAAASLGNEIGQVDVWHGSPHRFERMSTEKIGTGEGAQSFGYGLYFTDKKEIAQHYQKTSGFGFGHSQNQVFVNGEKIDGKSILSEAFSQADGDFNAAKKYINDLYESTMNSGDGNPQRIIDAANEFKKIVSSGSKVEIKKGSLYRAQLFPGKDPSEYTFLDWHGDVDKQIYQKISAQAKKEGVADIDEIMGKVDKEQWQYIYANLSDILGSDKEASAFLKRAGIDGIRYPTETLSGKGPKGSGAYNYVVFDDNDVRLVSRESGDQVEDLNK